jgi:hypothetical protein
MRFFRYSPLLTAGLGLMLLAFTPAAITYEAIPNHFHSHPDGPHPGPTHGEAVVDLAGNVYVSTDTQRGILVFGPDGKYLRSFGPSHVHGMQLQKEAAGEFLYCARPNFGEVLKLKTDGAEVWKMGYPQASGKYANAGEFHPTNVVSTPNGEIFVADGYGKRWIHKYDAERRYVKSFGGPGTTRPVEEGRFDTCHGLAVDLRGTKPMLVVCNRESGRVEHWDTDGNFKRVLARDLRLPAAVQVNHELVAIAELGGRVTVLGRDNQVVTRVGNNRNPGQRANYGLETSAWTEGITNAPHGISFDREGNLIVAEWSRFGRVSKFKVKR